MATKPKHTNRAKVTIWNKSLRMDTEGSIPSVAITTFTMINTLEGMERTLAQMQAHFQERQAREANHADVQAV